jgi:hypothetical protein
MMKLVWNQPHAAVKRPPTAVRLDEADVPRKPGYPAWPGPHWLHEHILTTLSLCLPHPCLLLVSELGPHLVLGPTSL